MYQCIQTYPTCSSFIHAYTCHTFRKKCWMASHFPGMRFTCHVRSVLVLWWNPWTKIFPRASRGLWGGAHIHRGGLAWGWPQRIDFLTSNKWTYADLYSYIYISSNESIYLHITTDTFMTSHHNMLLRTSGSFWFRQAPAAEDWWTPQRLICLTLQGIEYDDLQLWSWNRLLMGCWMIIRFIGIANVVLDDIKWYCRYHQCKKSNNKNTQWVVV